MSNTPEGAAVHCACVADMNARLKDEYNGILVTTLFGSPPKVSIEVEKRDPKIRQRPPRVIASFCPFCGESYTKATGAA